MYYMNISQILCSRIEVTAKISSLFDSPTCALNCTHGGQQDGSDGLKVLQDGRAGRVPHVKELTCKLNFVNFNFVVQSQLRKP